MNQEKLPDIEIEPTQKDKIIDAFALLFLALLFLLPLAYFSYLPDRIPTHFNAAGQPDDYGGKNSIWLLPGVGLFTYLMFSYINKMKPSNFSYPTKITPENAASKYRNTLEMLRWMKLLLMVLFLYLVWMTIQAGLGNTAGLHSWFIWVFLAAVAVPIVYFGFIKK